MPSYTKSQKEYKRMDKKEYIMSEEQRKRILDLFLDKLEVSAETNKYARGLFHILTSEETFTAEDIKECNEKGLFFTIHELRGFIYDELRKENPQDIDGDLIKICVDTIKSGKYYDNLDEAERHYQDKPIK